MTTEHRFFIDQDNDSHWYLVEDDHRTEWQAWLAIDSDDPASWEPPDFAKPLNTCPSLITFLDPT